MISIIFLSNNKNAMIIIIIRILNKRFEITIQYEQLIHFRPTFSSRRRWRPKQQRAATSNRPARILLEYDKSKFQIFVVPCYLD
jgi:hypothetical protein